VHGSQGNGNKSETVLAAAGCSTVDRRGKRSVAHEFYPNLGRAPTRLHPQDVRLRPAPLALRTFNHQRLRRGFCDRFASWSRSTRGQPRVRSIA